MDANLALVNASSRAGGIAIGCRESARAVGVGASGNARAGARRRARVRGTSAESEAAQGRGSRSGSSWDEVWLGRWPKSRSQFHTLEIVYALGLHALSVRMEATVRTTTTIVVVLAVACGRCQHGLFFICAHIHTCEPCLYAYAGHWRCCLG